MPASNAVFCSRSIRLATAGIALLAQMSAVSSGSAATTRGTPSQPVMSPSAPIIESHPDWIVVRDVEFGFTLRCPPNLVRLPEPSPLPDRRPSLVARLRLLDRELAAGDTAQLEPPTLAVEIFAPTAEPLRDWLKRNGRQAAGVSPVTVPGAIEAVRVRFPRLSAPNDFLYVRTARAVLALIPLGADGEAALSTLQLD